MKIINNITINLTADDVKEIILEYISKQGYATTKDNVAINLVNVPTGYGINERYETKFTGCSVTVKSE